MHVGRRTITSISLGTALTLLSAWIPPLIDPPMVRFPGLGLPPDQSVPWIGSAQTEWLGEPAWLATEGRDGRGVRRSIGCVEVFDLAYAANSQRWHFVVTSGWPFYAFHGGGVQYPPAGVIRDPRAPAVLTLPSWVPTRQNHAPSIPVAPLWRGLTLNLLLWTLAVFALLHSVGVVRVALRRRARRCVVCGYPLTGPNLGCSECGEGAPPA